MKRFALLLMVPVALITGCGSKESSQAPVTVTVPAATVTAPSGLEQLPFPVSLTGNGNKISEGIPLEAGQARIMMQYNGEGIFILSIRDADAFCETYEEQITNTAGSYSESKTINIPDSRTYFFEVRSESGDWSIMIDQ